MHVSRQGDTASELLFKLGVKNDCIYHQGANVSLEMVFDCFAFGIAAYSNSMDNK